MPTSTTNYALQKPLVNSAVDQDRWGDELNADLDSIDTLLKTGITLSVSASQTSGFSAAVSISAKNLYPCDATGGAIIALLPTAAAAGNGAIVAFEKTDVSTNAVIITRASTDTIDGATTYPLSLQYTSAILVSDGVNAWRIIAKTNSVFTGDSGSGGTVGLVPAPAAGDAAAGKFLKANGAWAVPAYPDIVLGQGNITSLATTPSVAGGKNIASVSRTSLGTYAVTFTLAAADTNYIPTGTVTMAAHPDMFICNLTLLTANGFTFQTKTSSNDLFDPDNVRLAIFKGN